MQFFALGVCALGALSFSPACERKPAPAAAPAPSGDKVEYTVRGEVVQVPVAGNPSAEFQVRHESLPHFRNEDGSLGMTAMIMPFPLHEGLSLADLKVGDKIELTFQVESDSGGKLLAYSATALAPLPPETVLDFTPLKK